MKQLTALALALICLLPLAACGSEKGQAYLNAQVLEIGETELMVECIEEPFGQLTGTEVRVSTEVISAVGIPQIQVGDSVRVVYDFDKVDKKNEPVNIGHVCAIYLLDENGDVIPNG